MANVATQQPNGAALADKAAPVEVIPDIIEERRKDAEGRIVSNRYLRGKLLGKVSLQITHIFV